jgi:leucyl/phenylalanyl-tRNA--protein transferase
VATREQPAEVVGLGQVGDAPVGSGPVEPPVTPWAFPDPAVADADDDVVCQGGDLQPGTLLAAYRRGLFPMPVPGLEPMCWWSPVRRGVLPLDNLRVSRSLRQSAKRFQVTTDAAFEDVLGWCAGLPRHGAWITDEVAAAYLDLHRLGWAHSVEVWDADGALAGGLYGVAVGGLFAGESMFHAQRDASKVALLALVDAMRSASSPEHRLLDVQWCTPHLASLGAVEIPRLAYLDRLQTALRLPAPVF